jgi:hypothetical protein
MTAVCLLSLTLMWFEGQVADDNEEDVLDLARQFAALRVTAVTLAGRRLSPLLQQLRLQYRELQVEELQGQLHFMRQEGQGYLAQLRAVIMTYRPGPMVTQPLPFPEASWRFGERDYPHMELVDEVLTDDLGLSMEDVIEVLHTY